MFIYALFPGLMLLVFGGLFSLWMMLYQRPDEHLEKIAVRVGWIAAALYALWLTLLSIDQRQLPILTAGQISVFLAFLVWMDQLLVERRISQRMLTVLPIVIVTVLLLTGVAGGLRHTEGPRELHSIWSAVHIVLSTAGVAMLFGSGVYSAGAILLRRVLVQRKFGRLFTALPSMDDMHRLRALAVYNGWLLITISFASSTVFMFIQRAGTPSFFNHLHEMFALWFVATILAISERKNWLGDQRQAKLTVALTALMFFLLAGSVTQIFFRGQS